MTVNIVLFEILISSTRWILIVRVNAVPIVFCEHFWRNTSVIVIYYDPEVETLPLIYLSIEMFIYFTKERKLK